MARRVRASVRLWQTELFVTVIVVAILILSASLTQGLQRTLTDAGTASQLRNASALASQLSEQFPMTPASLQRIRSQVASYHSIYGDSVWVYATDGRVITSAVTASPPADILQAARIQGLADNPPYSTMSLKGDGYVVAGKAIYQPSGERVGTVVVSGSVDAAMAVLEAVRSRLWVTFWVALIVAGALGFAFSEFIGRRIRAMSEAAASIADGDFSQRLPTGWLPDEIHDLALSYNRMASKLGEAFSAVRQRESEIAAVVESLAEGVIAFDSAGTVRVINPGARRLLSDPDVDLTGAAASVITSDPAVLDAIAAGLAGNAATAVTQLGPHTVLLHSTPLLDATDQATGAVLLLSDITEQKRLDDAQRRFVANASHEMRTPIAAIKGLLELLEDGAKDDPAVRDDFIGTMQLEVDRLGRLVADLLTLAQLEAGTFALDVEPESAESLLGRVAGVMRALADRAGVELAVELPAGDLMVMADRDRIVQVLLGFADNALKHSKRGQRVELRARRSGASAVLEVADQGPGIAAGDVDRIFDRFYRADEARSSRGAGLGLAIAKEIAEAHGTTVTVSSTDGGGATFGLELPLAE
ncbi:MAG: ATP-binding protein [Coriobacteriia bacterium]|nr:ATP-binding protein [Coriobacteriia bacterium]